MTDDTQTKLHESCGLQARRVFEPFGFHRFPEHFNHSVGKPVSSSKQFTQELRRASEEATERTGVPHDYQPVHPSEVQPAGGGVGLDKTARRHRELGWTESASKIF